LAYKDYNLTISDLLERDAMVFPTKEAVVLGDRRYSYFDLADLASYYKDCVITGPGSFVLAIKKKEEFATAIRQKLLLEIAGREPDRPARIRHIQFTAPPTGKYDCLIGEKMWQEYRNDDW